MLRCLDKESTSNFLIEASRLIIRMFFIITPADCSLRFVGGNQIGTIRRWDNIHQAHSSIAQTNSALRSMLQWTRNRVLQPASL